MKKDDILFVRVDYRVEGPDMTDKDVAEHIAYVGALAKERYMLGGGFLSADGGMMVFEADNLDEAQKITMQDPLIAKGFYRAEVYEWQLMVLSEGV